MSRLDIHGPSTTPLGGISPPQLDAPSPTSAAPPDDYVPLTPEGLLFFCQSRMRELDDAIGKKMSGQQDLVALQAIVGGIESKLKADGSNGFNDKGKVDDVAKSIGTAIEAAERCGDSKLVTTLESVMQKLHDGGNYEVTPDEIKDMCGMLDTALSASRSSAEISMIELQSLVSKRATQLQLTTGMMNSVDEAPKAIAANIGR